MSVATTEHPEHARLTQIVRGWYTQSWPELGYVVEDTAYGLVGWHVSAPSAIRVTLRDVSAADVPAMLAALRARYGAGPLTALVERPADDATLGPALVAAGSAPGVGESFLAHVGPPPEVAPPPELRIEPITPATLDDWVTVKLQGFANSDAAPDPARAADERAARAAELAGGAVLLLARWSGEPAAALAGYDGPERFAFSMATRVPFRKRGIASALLSTFARDGYARGCRAILLNADPDDTPIQLYRRLGFTDEVYWRRRYVLPGAHDHR
jgi:GNAT superfamily N-acetyltransferase